MLIVLLYLSKDRGITVLTCIIENSIYLEIMRSIGSHYIGCMYSIPIYLVIISVDFVSDYCGRLWETIKRMVLVGYVEIKWFFYK